MGYESLSTIIVLVILAILMTIWLPKRTVKGMKQVEKHHADRYSTSLHVLDEDSGTRFSDEETPQLKGVIMPATRNEQKSTTTYIEHVRSLRRASAQRRRILVGLLLSASVIVFVLAILLHFSPLFTLIPVAALAVVLYMGVQASKQARAWEAKVAKKERDRKTKELAKRKAAVQRAKAAQEAAKNRPARDEDETNVMEQREIRKALRQAKLEQTQALREREAHAQELAKEAAEHKDHAQLVVRSEINHYPADETNELSRVHPASAVDAFDMAVSQDLISFSLGEERNGVEHPVQEPQSLEIKSTKQVAKAVPVEESSVQVEDEQVEEQEETVSETAEQSVEVNNSAAFHEAETSADVEAPDETTDSLGVSLESILARRGN